MPEQEDVEEVMDLTEIEEVQLKSPRNPWRASKC
jgi:hypothetical protein